MYGERISHSCERLVTLAEARTGVFYDEFGREGYPTAATACCL